MRKREVTIDDCKRFVSALHYLQTKANRDHPEMRPWIHLDLIRRMFFHKSHDTFQSIVEHIWRNREILGLRVEPVNVVATIVRTKRYKLEENVYACGFRMLSVRSSEHLVDVQPIRTYEEAIKSLSR